MTDATADDRRAPAPDGSLTDVLATFVCETPRQSLSPELSRAARRALLDSIGVTIGAAEHPAAVIARDVVRATTTGGPCTVAGTRWRAGVADAALLNGVMAHVLDFDDTLLPTRLHPSAVLVPALLAVGEWRDLPGDRVLDALPFGFEVQARFAAATYPDFARRGWHGTGIYGGVGAAVAVGRLLSLPADRMAHAMAIAASGGAGVMAVFGSMAKSLNLGRAAAVGVQAALLAESGFTGADVLGGDAPFLRLFADAPDLTPIARNLGTDWAILHNGFKPYPCGVVGHAAIDAVLALRERAPTRGLRALQLTVSPETMRLMGNLDPSTELEAKFSVRFVAAAAWLDGQVGLGSFEEHRVTAERTRQAMEAIRIDVDEAMPQDAARAQAETVDGWRRSERVDHARGTAERPMSDTDLRIKLRSVVPTGRDVDALLAVIDDFERLSVRDLVRHLAP